MANWWNNDGEQADANLACDSLLRRLTFSHSTVCATARAKTASIFIYIPQHLGGDKVCSGETTDSFSKKHPTLQLASSVT